VVSRSAVCWSDSRFCRTPAVNVMLDMVVPFWLRALLDAFAVLAVLAVPG
jgi:hypothetical protein